MTTSAQSLNQILTVASNHRVASDQFVTVIADYLGFDGPNAQPEVVLRLYSLVKKVQQDVENLPHDEAYKKHARTYIAPFLGLTSFSHIHLNMQNAKSNFLKPDNLVGLTALHMILTGHIETPDIDNETKELSLKFHELREEVFASDLPDHAKKIVAKRLGQISSMLEHFYVFGAEVLQEEIESLVGAIVVNQQTNNKENYAIYKKIAKVSGIVLIALKGVDVALGTTLSIAENGPKLLEFAKEIIGPSS